MQTPKEWTAYAREECETFDPGEGVAAVDWQRFGDVVEEIVGTSQGNVTAEFVASLRVANHIQAAQRCENCSWFKARQSADEPNDCLNAASPIAAIGPWHQWWCPRFEARAT